MLDRLEVIKGLRCCIPPRDKEERDDARECRHEQCPYEIHQQGDFGCFWELMTDALSYLELQDEVENEAQIAMSLNYELNKKLKEQEAAKPIFIENPYTHLPVSYCPQCREPIDKYIVGNPYKMTKFCHYCGKAVNWDE